MTSHWLKECEIDHAVSILAYSTAESGLIECALSYSLGACVLHSSNEGSDLSISLHQFGISK